MIMHNDLSQFTGTEHYYKHWLGCMFTDGVKYLAEKAKAYWLIDAVMSYETKKTRQAYPFQIWDLKVKDGSAVLTMKEDTDQPVKISQKIGVTDFPLDEIKLYFIDNVLLLPSEY